QGAGLVAAVLARSRPRTVRHLVLLHLSQECNLPRLALEVARTAVRDTGWRVALHAARQATAHPNLRVKPTRRRTTASRARGSLTLQGPGADPRLEFAFGADDEAP